MEAFRHGLRELGYIDGQNAVIEYRWARGREELLPGLAADLVRLEVDVIVASGPAKARQLLAGAGYASGFRRGRSPFFSIYRARLVELGGVGLGEGVRGLLVGRREGGHSFTGGTVEFGVPSRLPTELVSSLLARSTSPFADLPHRRGVTGHLHLAEPGLLT